MVLPLHTGGLNIQEYIDKLHQEMHKVMGKPVTLGGAEEVTVYADAICSLHKLSGDHFRESTKMIEFAEDDAKAWMANMQNAEARPARIGRWSRRTLWPRSAAFHRTMCPAADFVSILYSAGAILLVQMCNILHVHRMPKTPESVDIQRKTSNLNGLLVLFLWWLLGEPLRTSRIL